MSDVTMDPIVTIQRTRKTTAKILEDASRALVGSTEKELADTALRSLEKHSELYPAGWYDPPPGGCSMLFDRAPFARLGYETLRDRNYWPSENVVFDEESVGLLYVSSVDRATKLFGDTGLTVYLGKDERVQQHIREVHDVIRATCDVAEVGMTFTQLNEEAMQLFASRHKAIRWMVTYNDPLKGANLGHTVPGSMGDETPGGSFEEVKGWLTKGRTFINRAEQFVIPATCAFTMEARLVDTRDETLPNTFFHFIVAFSNGERRVFSDFDAIFQSVGMTYML